MKVLVKIIGRFQEVIGKKELAVEINDDATIWDVIEILVQKFPSFESERKFIMVSCNNTFSTLDKKVSEGDVITLFPPIVSGG